LYWRCSVGKGLGQEKVRVDEEPEVERPKKKLRTPAQCRRLFQDRISGSIEAIVDGFVKEAKKGSCPHVKLTNELLEAAIEEKAARKKGPGERMVDEWLREGKAKRARGENGQFVC